MPISLEVLKAQIILQSDEHRDAVTVLERKYASEAKNHGVGTFGAVNTDALYAELEALNQLDRVAAMALTELCQYGVTARMLLDLPIKHGSFSLGEKDMLGVLVQQISAADAMAFFKKHYQEYKSDTFTSVLGLVRDGKMTVEEAERMDSSKGAKPTPPTS